MTNHEESGHGLSWTGPRLSTNSHGGVSLFVDALALGILTQRGSDWVNQRLQGE